VEGRNGPTLTPYVCERAHCMCACMCVHACMPS